jgi:hydrogenase maturation protease
VKTIVIGLGNPILGDDGFGWRVVESIRPSLDKRGISAECLAEAGLGLMERVIGFDKLIVVDCVVDEKLPIGEVLLIDLGRHPFWGAHFRSAHEADLQTALKVGTSLGEKLPAEIKVVAVSVEKNFILTEKLSEKISAAVPMAAALILDLF